MRSDRRLFVSRTFFSVLAFMALFIAASGCVGQLAPQPAKEKTLVVADAMYPSSYNPGEGGNASLIWLMQVYNALTWREPKGSNVQPALATSWRTLDDKTWEFKLRQGVKFHNGAPFNAQAVKFTMDWTLDPKRTYARKSRIAGISDTQVVDDYTVVFKTKDPFPLLPIGLRDIPILEPGYVKEKGDDYLFSNPIGTGPWRFVEWRRGDRAIFRANQDYWGGRPKVDRLELRQISEASTRVATMKAGETHIIGAVPVDLLGDLQVNTDVKIVAVNADNGVSLTFNLLQEGPLKNQKVREAIDYAIDKEAIWKSLYKGYGAVLDGQIVTKGAFGYNPELKPRPYDPEKAKQLLAEAGYPNGLSMLLNVSEGRFIMDKEQAIAISGQLAKVGINARVNLLEQGVWNEQLSSQKLQDAHLIVWWNFGDADFATIWYVKGTGRDYWNNPEYDRLIQAGRTTLDTQKRQQIYRQATQLMYEQLPAAFTMQLPSIYAVSNRVTNWEPYSSEMLYFKDTDLKD